jgi:hypothetical protein
MNSKSKEVNCLTGWSASEPDENLTPKALTAVEKMLHTSKLYLKADRTKMGSDSKPPAKTDLLNETQIHQ